MNDDSLLKILPTCYGNLLINLFEQRKRLCFRKTLYVRVKNWTIVIVLNLCAYNMLTENTSGFSQKTSSRLEAPKIGEKSNLPTS